MAITKTDKIERISIVLKDPADTSVIVVQSKTTWDDPNDDQLPIDRESVKSVEKYTIVYDDNQQPSTIESDISGESQLIKDICAVVWTDD